MLSRKLHFAIRFARFCTEMSLDPTDAAQLVDLAMRRARACERESWGPQYIGQEDRAAARFEAHCQHMGLAWRYDALYPTVSKGTEFRTLPYPD
jgi:hypothetical protein